MRLKRVLSCVFPLSGRSVIRLGGRVPPWSLAWERWGRPLPKDALRGSVSAQHRASPMGAVRVIGLFLTLCLSRPFRFSVWEAILKDPLYPCLFQWALSRSPSLSTYCSHSIPFSLLLSLLPSPSILPSLSLSPFLTGVIFQRLFPLCQSHRCSVLLHSGSHTSVCLCVFSCLTLIWFVTWDFSILLTVNLISKRSLHTLFSFRRLQCMYLISDNILYVMRIVISNQNVPNLSILNYLLNTQIIYKLYNIL